MSLTHATAAGSHNISTAAWDAGHVFGGGATGSLLYYDDAQTDKHSWLADVATGNVLLSGGLATAPAWGKVTSAHITFPTSGAFGYLSRSGTSLLPATAGDAYSSADVFTRITNATSAAVADNGVIFLGTTSVVLGLLVVIDVTLAVSGAWHVWGTNGTVVVVNANATFFSTTKNTNDKVNVYYDPSGPSGAGYYLQNCYTASHTFRVVLIG